MGSAIIRNTIIENASNSMPCPHAWNKENLTGNHRNLVIRVFAMPISSGTMHNIAISATIPPRPKYVKATKIPANGINTRLSKENRIP